MSTGGHTPRDHWPTLAELRAEESVWPPPPTNLTREERAELVAELVALQASADGAA